LDGKNEMISKDTNCPVCGEYSFEFPDDYDNCPICGWENDGLQRDQKDFWGGANVLSVNESKVVYSLIRNEATKSKVSEIIDKYEQRRKGINTQFRGIDHRTAKGEECRKAFAQAHSDFIVELDRMSWTQHEN